MKEMINGLGEMCNDESGQGLAEYGLIIALIAVVVILALTSLGENIMERFNDISDEIGGAAPGGGGGAGGP